jgi:hypothetical protein
LLPLFGVPVSLFLRLDGIDKSDRVDLRPQMNALVWVAADD